MRSSRTRPRFLFWSALALSVVLSAVAGAAAPAGFHLIRSVTLGGDGGWDYLTFDEVGHRLFISRSTHVMVVDADSLTIIGDIPDTPGVHGIALAPALGRGFTSNGRDTSVTMFDLTSLRASGRVRVGLRPDAITYDPASKRVFTMNGGSNDASAIDPVTGTVVGTIPLGGRPEEAVCDGAGHMYVNLEDTSQVVAVDTQAMKVIGRWSLAPGAEPTGIAMDVAHGLVFSGCANNKMVVSDVKRGAVVTTLPIGSGVDGMGFDPGSGLAFSSNGEGSLTVVHEDSPTKFKVVATVPTAPRARTVAFDPHSRRAFLITASFGPAPAATAEQPHPRPAMVPGSFQLLVFGE